MIFFILYILISTTAMAEPIVVAVVDTGLELSHPAFQNARWVNSLEQVGQPGVDDDGNGYVDDLYGYNFVDRVPDPSHQTVNDHGTHVAGLVLQGFSAAGGQGVRILPVNVYGSQPFASPIEALNEGIRYAARMGASVINVSVSSPGTSSDTEAAVREATQRGALLVAAAGNTASNLDQNEAFPGSYGIRFPEVISVAALDIKNLSLCDRSSYGPLSVLLAAPGCDPGAPLQGILSARRGGTYGYKSGTSMAAPFVAGQLAAWQAQSGQVGSRDLGLRARQWLASIAAPLPSLQDKVGLAGATR